LALPPITFPVVINGYSQPGSSCNTLSLQQGDNAVLLIVLSGTTTTPAASNGLTISGGGSTVTGLVINNFPLDGINLRTLGYNFITGNFLGTDQPGTLAVPNGSRGISVNSGYNTIGGTTPCARNLISGNKYIGVHIGPSSASQNKVQGNYIGTTASGMAALGNQGYGVLIQAASNNLIGGLDAGNLISGNNSVGVGLSDNGGTTTHNWIQGNMIGPKRNNTYLSAVQTRGVSIVGNPSYNTVGGTTPGGTKPGEGNRIAYNGDIGVVVVGPSTYPVGNAIQGNSITANTQLGIDLGADGVSVNDDSPDADGGPNQYQNFPILSASTSLATAVGAITSAPNMTYTLEFFANTACDPSNYGEGDIFLGRRDVTTDESGYAAFSYTYSYGTAPTGSLITSTATDIEGNTSEFSPCLVAQPAPNSCPCPMDVAFVIDDSGSMQSSLNQLQAGFPSILSAIQTTSGNNYRLSLVTFKDDITVWDN
jgi:titin